MAGDGLPGCGGALGRGAGRSPWKLLALALASGLLVVVVAACAPAAAPSPTATAKPAAAPAATPTAAPAAKPTEKPAPLSLNSGLIYAKGAFSWVTWWVAQARGIFAKNGLEQKMTDFSDATTMLNTLGKDVDYIGVGSEVTLQFFKAGRKDVRIIASALVPNLNQILVPKDSPIKSPADLKGKKIGITLPGGKCHVTALLMLKEAGIKPEEVTFISGGAFPELWTAAKTGQTDAACQTPPLSALKVADGEARYLFKTYEKVKPVPQEAVVATTTEVIKNKREALQRVVNSLVEAGQWTEANREEAAKVFAQQIGIPEKISVAVMTEEIPKGGFIPALSMENLLAVEDSMKLGGVLEPTYKTPWAEIVDTSFLPPDLRKEIR